MPPTEMDQLTAPGEAETLLPPEPYSPAPVRTSRPSAWISMFHTRERRWWTMSLSAALLITLFGIGVLYVDDTNNQAAARSLTTQNESLTGRNQILNERLMNTQTNLKATHGELAMTNEDLEHSHPTICNVST